MSQRSRVQQLVHIVWATHGRRPLLPVSRDGELRRYFHAKAAELGCLVVACGCADDHAHVLARIRSTVPLAVFVQRLKGASSHDLASADWPLQWQERYWAESVSPADARALAEYIHHQRDRHDASRAEEAWQAALELAADRADL